MRDPLARYRALRDAALTISSDLSLASVLQKIVDVARDLVQCRYAALGVLREDGKGLSDFIVSGLDRETIERLGAWPRGLGLLGVVIDDPRALRVANIGADPRSVGFPPAHPPMKSLLAAPIAWRGRVFGNFYLADRVGAEAFDAEDEELLVALAAHAAVAIENATLYSQTDQHLRRVVRNVERAEERARFLVELSTLLPSGPIVDEPPFDAALERLTSLLGDACILCLAPSHGGAIRHVIVHRDPMRRKAAEEFITDSWRVLCGEVLKGGRSLLVEDAAVATGGELDKHTLERLKFTAAMALPVRSGERTHGVLLTLGTSPLRFTREDLAFAHLVAERLATAIENARLLKELGDALRAREEFVSIATHELRSPVTAILASAEMARRYRETPERVTSALDVIARQGKRLAVLTDELLEISRIRSGRVSLNRERREMSTLVRTAVDRYRAELEPAERERLSLGLPAEAVWGDWDEMRVEQVLQNLLANAFKFSPDGGAIAVTVTASPDIAAIEVRDHGLGIGAADMSHLFEPFFRAGSATARKIRGFGLGLTICRTIAREHGGDLVCESVEGAGSTFTLALPLTAAKSASSDTGMRERRGDFGAGAK